MLIVIAGDTNPHQLVMINHYHKKPSITIAVSLTVDCIPGVHRLHHSTPGSERFTKLSQIFNKLTRCNHLATTTSGASYATTMMLASPTIGNHQRLSGAPPNPCCGARPSVENFPCFKDGTYDDVAKAGDSRRLQHQGDKIIVLVSSQNQRQAKSTMDQWTLLHVQLEN